MSLDNLPWRLRIFHSGTKLEPLEMPTLDEIRIPYSKFTLCMKGMPFEIQNDEHMKYPLPISKVFGPNVKNITFDYSCVIEYNLANSTRLWDFEECSKLQEIHAECTAGDITCYFYQKFPKSLKYLNPLHMVPNNNIPFTAPSLTYLYISPGYNPRNTIFEFPQQLITLKLGSASIDINKYPLPDTVRILHLIHGYEHPIKDNTLPARLEELYVCYSYTANITTDILRLKYFTHLEISRYHSFCAHLRKRMYNCNFSTTLLNI